jgi:hypothetical protein
LSQHVSRFRRWESLTANTILNFLEVVFWLTVIILKIQGMQQICLPIGCDLSKAVTAFAFLILYVPLSHLFVFVHGSRERLHC